MATDWANAVLAGLGITPTAQSVDFLHMWAGREGVPQTIDRYNWLGTTLPIGGSHGTNGPGVQSYGSFVDGVTATVKMLSQSNFSAIRGALASGAPQTYAGNAQVQSEFRTWSGGGYSWPQTSARVTGTGTGNLSFSDAEALAKAGLSGHTNQFDFPGGGTVSSAVGAVSSVGDFLSRLTDPNYLIRGLQILGGAGLVAGGLFLLAKQIGLASSVPGPVGNAVGAVE
jgi:hypothetical protein